MGARTTVLPAASKVGSRESPALNDDKRLLRKLKRDVKRAGNRKRRQYLKDVSAEPGDFDFGSKRSDVMNERPKETGKDAK